MGNEGHDIGDNAPHRLVGRDAVATGVADILGRAHRFVSIYAPMLEPTYFNTPAVREALAHLTAGGRPNAARILVEQGDATVRNNGRIADLAQRMSGFVQIRELSEETPATMEMYVLIDRDGYLHQKDTGTPQCIIDFSTASQRGALARRFDQLWERSQPIPGLHVTGLSR
jgi:hypothetical protein